MGAVLPLIVLDTHAWLWYQADPSRLSRKARHAIDRAPELGVSTMSAWELMLLQSAGRIRIATEAREWVARALADSRSRALPVTLEIALRAGGLHGLRDPADKLIFATAAELDVPLVSRDARMAELDAARIIW